jgi:hypothetical protein
MGISESWQVARAAISAEAKQVLMAVAMDLWHARGPFRRMATVGAVVYSSVPVGMGADLLGLGPTPWFVVPCAVTWGVTYLALRRIDSKRPELAQRVRSSVLQGTLAGGVVHMIIKAVA